MSNVPHDLYFAVMSLREGGAVEQGSVVVYQPSCSMTAGGAEYTTALEAIHVGLWMPPGLVTSCGVSAEGSPVP